MRKFGVDVAVIGAGPAGLAAALEADRLGVGKVLLLERDSDLGGILQQCIHDGFGIHRFNKRLSGNQYAQAFIDRLPASSVEVLCGTMVLELGSDRTIVACNPKMGILEISCGAVILAMGCRERTAAQALIFGDRPAGIMTAGAVQKYINIDGYLPGTNAVILGSGDIGLIMARRMTLEGIKVHGVYELMPSPGGLARNIVQCLDDFGIPLHLSQTVVSVKGRDRLESVTVAKVDGGRNPIPGTEKEVACDLLALAVGLIPENELSLKAGVEIDARTKGPVVDSSFMTSVPGIFAAGNVAAVFDLVDYVSDSAEIAARGAVAFVRGERGSAATEEVNAGNNVSFVVPHKICQGSHEKRMFFLRVKQAKKRAELVCSDSSGIVHRRRHNNVAPPEMISFEVSAAKGPLLVEMREVGGT